MTERRYQPGDLVFREGEDAAFVCRIVSGKAELIRGQGPQQAVVDRLGPGDVTESMAVLEGQRRAAGLRAVTELSIEIIDKQRFLRRVAGDGELAFKLLMYLSDRLHTMQNHVARAPSEPAAARPADAPPAARPAPKPANAASAPGVAHPSPTDGAHAPRLQPASKPAGAAMQGAGPAAAPPRPDEPRQAASAPPRPAAPAGASALSLSAADGPVAAPLIQPAQPDRGAAEAVLQAEERPAAAPADQGAAARPDGGEKASASASPQAAAGPSERSAAPAEARRDPQPPAGPAARQEGGRTERFPWEPTHGRARPNARIRIVPASELMTRVMPLEGIVVDRLPFLVGRRTDKTERQVWVDLAIGDSRPYRLSRAHFSLTMRDGQYILCDLDSAHGTQVNGTPLGRDGTTDFAPLLDGDNLVVAGGRDSPYSFHVVVEPG